MATRSRIGVKEGAKVRSIYCHNDGYVEPPWGVGWVLHSHYRDPAKVAELIALGDLSSLGKFVAPAPGQKHGFGNGEGPSPAKDVTVAYSRDRKNSHPAEPVLHDPKSWPDTDAVYLYLFNPKTATWRYAKAIYGGSPGRWVTLNDKFFAKLAKAEEETSHV